MKGFRLWTDFRWIVRAAGHISIPVGWIAGWQAGRIDHFLIWQNRFLQWRMCHTRNLRLPLSWKKLSGRNYFPELCKPFCGRRGGSRWCMEIVLPKKNCAVYWPGKLCHWQIFSFFWIRIQKKKELLNITVSFQQEEWASGKICKILWTADHWYRKRQQS